MPPKTEKGRREAKEVATFVSELYSSSDFSSWGEFARSVGIAAATMSDYKRAENAPSGYRLLKMIRAAGWKAKEGADRPTRLESLEGQISECVALVREALELLREARGPVDEAPQVQRSA